MHDRMPQSTWTFWFLAGSLAGVGLGLLLAPISHGERVGGDEDVHEGPHADAGRTVFAGGVSGQVS
jgi:hypothetical protein